MFILFKSALTSRPLFVNPSLVRTVVEGDQMGQVKICSTTNTVLRFKVRRRK